MATNPSFSRTVAERSTADEFQFSELPEFPMSLKNRFPEFKEWAENMNRWNAENSRRLRDSLTQLKGR
jgi:hypothetical protein